MRLERAGRRCFGIVLSLLLLFALCDPFAQAAAAQADAAAQQPVLSEGQKNIVKRAYQMTHVRWRPLSDVTGWRYELTYKAGTTYVGIPYGQPVKAAYVPWDASLLEFVNAVNQPNSKMYTDYSSFTARAPYYSVDCSGFVSYAWDVPYRTPSASLEQWATVIKNATYQDLQVGDALCRPGVHASLVTDVVYDSNGKVISVEISEATTGKSTNACCHSIRYGEGGVNTIDRITTRFFRDGYLLMRCNTRDSATYTHSCASPLPGDNCDLCGAGQITETPEDLTLTREYAVTLYALPSAQSVQIGTVYSGAQIRVTASYMDRGGRLWYKTANGEWFLSEFECEHEFTYTITQKPTCTQNGTGYYRCGLCLTTHTVEVQALGHAYNVKVVKPTCTTEGYTQYHCADCGDDYQDSTVPATGHDYEDDVCVSCGSPKVEYIRGDLDGDGVVDNKDVAHLLWHTLFPVNYPVSQNADFTGDGTVDNQDVAYLLWHTLFPGSYPLD